MPIINRERPNTGVDDVFLSANTILCCGEDWQELLAALSSITGAKARLYHEYRCYRIAKFDTFSLIWSGMGTGCLEPLLYELSGALIIKNLVLIGTAGATSTDRINLGELYIVEEAFLGGTAVHLAENLPFKPRFGEDLLAGTNLGRANLVSTDYYYGFSQNVNTAHLRLADQTLKSAVDTLLVLVGLVDMETAQFYYFCETLFPKDGLNYVSLKGAANSLTDQALQTTHSFEILRKALVGSFVLLGVKPQPQPVANASVRISGDETSNSKLMEEVKLYWTIQIAVCGVLGYLGTNLTFNMPSDKSAIAGVLLKNLCISSISFFLIQIGAIYNLIGNYYARVAATGSTLEAQQENRITPTLAVFYLIISGAITALGLKAGVPSSADSWLFVAGLVGVAINLICGAFIYGGLVQKHRAYDQYATPLRTVYIGAALAAGFAAWSFVAWKVGYAMLGSTR
jgi:uncharacterized membrane protein SirB2